MITTQPIAGAFFADPALSPLIEAYRRECGDSAFVGAPAPDLERYRKLVSDGQLEGVAAYDDGHLVGFVLLASVPIAHYGDARLAVVESLYCELSARRRGAGRALLKAAKELARERGAVALNVCAPAGSRLERLLSLTARHVESVFLIDI